LRLRLPGTFFNAYDGRFARASTRRVWMWTPVTILASLLLSLAIMMCPLHPFYALMAMVLVPTAIIAGCKFLIPVRVAYPLQWIAGGSGFALVGATLGWWTYAIARAPQQENRLELCLLIGFWAAALIVIGCSSVTAIVLGSFDEEPDA
jgi:hypothetical protein